MILSPLIATALVLASPEDAIARVDGTAIPRSALVTRLEDARRVAGNVRPGPALEGLILETLLAAEARRMGLAGSPQVAAEILASTRRIAGDAFIQKIAETVKIDDARLRKTFHAVSDFASFESLAFERREQAEKALQRIRAGSTMATEAKTAVVSRTYPKPESAPPMMRGRLSPAMADAVFGARAGDVVGPLQDSEGWYVIKVIRVLLGTEADFAARHDQLLQNARAEAGAAVRKHLAEQLTAKATIKIDEAFLRGVDAAYATPDQLNHPVATVNGTALPYREVYATIRAVGRGHAGGMTVKMDVVHREIESRLIQDAAMKEGLTNAPSVVARRSEFERNALARAAAAKIQADVPPPSENEIQRFYEDNPARYEKPFAQILPIVVADASAQKRGVELKKRVDALRRKASVWIDSSALARMGN